jgi:hypothetical protein
MKSRKYGKKETRVAQWLDRFKRRGMKVEIMAERNNENKEGGLEKFYFHFMKTMIILISMSEKHGVFGPRCFPPRDKVVALPQQFLQQQDRRFS